MECPKDQHLGQRVEAPWRAGGRQRDAGLVAGPKFSYRAKQDRPDCRFQGGAGARPGGFSIERHLSSLAPLPGARRSLYVPQSLPICRRRRISTLCRAACALASRRCSCAHDSPGRRCPVRSSAARRSSRRSSRAARDRRLASEGWLLIRPLLPLRGVASGSRHELDLPGWRATVRPNRVICRK